MLLGSASKGGCVVSSSGSWGRHSGLYIIKEAKALSWQFDGEGEFARHIRRGRADYEVSLSQVALLQVSVTRVSIFCA
jgi:hypothetical protein